MNECEKFQEFISASVDNELSEDEKQLLADHLKTCPECAALYEAFSALSAEMQSDMSEMPQDLHENIMAELRRQDIKKKNRGSKKSFKTLIATAACAALIVAGAFIFKPTAADTPALMSLAPEDASSGNVEAYPGESYESGFEAKVFSAETAPAPSEADQAALAEEAPPVMAAPRAETKINSAAVFSAASSEYLLLPEQFDALIEFLSGAQLDIDADKLPEASMVISLISSEDSGRTLTVYKSEDTLIYIDSSDSNIYKAQCSLDELVTFLGNL